MLTTLTLVAAAVLSALRLWLLAQRERPTLFVHSALAPMLLLLVAPAAVSALEMIRTFEAIAQSGAGGLEAVQPALKAIWRGAAFGGLGALITIAIAASVQLRSDAAARADEAPPVAREGLGPSALWTLLVVPTAVVVYLATSIAPVLQMAAIPIGSPGAMASGTDIGAISSNLAMRAVYAILLGGLTTIAVVVFAACDAMFSRRAPSPQMRRLSWIVLGIVAAIALSNLRFLAAAL
jgi:hypothetical protein